MVILARRATLIGYKPLKKSLNLEYNDEKSLMLAIITLKGYASLWYEHLKKNRAREGKAKIRMWTKLKKHMDKRFLPFSYKQDLYL